MKVQTDRYLYIDQKDENIDVKPLYFIESDGERESTLLDQYGNTIFVVKPKNKIGFDL